MAASEQSLSALLASGLGSKKNHVNLKQGRHWLLAEFLSGIVDVLVLEIESTSMLETKGFTALFFDTMPEVKEQFAALDELGFLELVVAHPPNPQWVPPVDIALFFPCGRGNGGGGKFRPTGQQWLVLRVE